MKQKLPFIFTMAVVLLTSCTEKESEVGQTKVSLSFKNFSIGYAEEKASAVDAKINFLSVAIFGDNDSLIVQDGHFIGNDTAGFDQFNFNLDPGTYTIIAVGYKGADDINVATFASKELIVIERDRTMDTYFGNNTFTLNGQAEQTVNVTMNRAVSAFVIMSQNMVPDSIHRMQISFDKGSWNKLNPYLGFSAENTGSTQEILITDNVRSMNEPRWSFYTFLPADSASMNITVSAIDRNNGIPYTHSFTNVPMQRNRQTVATGRFFDAHGGTTFDFNTDWLGIYDITF